ncbi:hypothetical protein ACHQM5_012186 [Ranunculus cassubicifolius]
MERITATQQASLSYTLKPQLHEHPKQVAQLAKEEEISIFDAERYFNDGQEVNKKVNIISSSVDRSSDKCDVATIPRFSSVSSVDGYGRNYRTGSFNATPTASSEASWNSQSGLLSNPPGSIAVSMRNLRIDGNKKKNLSRGSSGKWFFRRRCPCTGKKSVQVEEKPKPKIQVHTQSNGDGGSLKNSSKQEEVCVDVFEKKSSRVEDERTTIEEVPRADTEDRYSAGNQFPAENGHRVVPSGRPFGDGGGFSFPILIPPPPPSARKLLPGILNTATISCNNTHDDPPRESLEVFQPIDDSLIQGKSMERRGMMALHEDINHRNFNFLPSPNIRKINDGDDDVMSDASSDLFEIESFSTQSTMYPMYRGRDSLDEYSSFDARSRFGRRSLDETTTTATPSIAPTECYEPSEASIDWSVTTAEGFSVANFSVSASEYDIQTDYSRKIVASKRRGNGGLLTSCRCEKAVNVATRPVKFVPDNHHHQNSNHHHNRTCGGAPAFPVESSRIQAASRLSVINIPITRSHSARMSRALTTH